jgi:hypothetical protein
MIAKDHITRQRNTQTYLQMRKDDVDGQGHDLFHFLWRRHDDEITELIIER